MKSRGIYETPGGTILLAAHRDLETLVIDRELQQTRDTLIPKYAQLVYNGFWFAPEREAIQALVTESQRKVTGEVRLKLYKGNVMQAGRRSPHSLYDEARRHHGGRSGSRLQPGRRDWFHRSQRPASKSQRETKVAAASRVRWCTRRQRQDQSLGFRRHRGLLRLLRLRFREEIDPLVKLVPAAQPADFPKKLVAFLTPFPVVRRPFSSRLPGKTR